MNNAGRAIGVIAVISAAILWGTTGTIQALLPAGKEPIIVGAMRIVLGGLALLALALLNPVARRGFRRLSLRTIIFAGLAIALYNLSFFVAVMKSGVGIGTAITVGSAPIWVTLYEIVVKKQIPDATRLFGQAVSICGAFLLVVSGGNATGSMLGYMIAAIAGAAYAAYSVATSRIGGTAPSVTIAAATFSVASVAVLPVFFMVPIAWMTGMDVWLPLLFLGVISTGLSYVFYTWGLTRVAASTAVTLALAEPLTAWLLATFVIGEDITAMKLVGATLLMIGLAIVTVLPAKSVRA